MKNSRNGWKICSNKAYTDVVSTERPGVDERMGENEWFFSCFLCTTNKKRKTKVSQASLLLLLIPNENNCDSFLSEFFSSVLYFNNGECLEMLLARMKCTLFWVFCCGCVCYYCIGQAFAIEFRTSLELWPDFLFHGKSPTIKSM